MKKKELINLSFRINKLILKKGKLSKINLILDKVYLLLSKSLKQNPLIILDEAISNIMPLFILNNKKIGKRVIISPKFILSDYSRKGIGIKWIVEAALKRKGKFSNNLYLEILEAFNDKGSVKKRQKDLNLVVLTNKSNLKYRW
jgi:small subunit ribosomal protein S7